VIVPVLVAAATIGLFTTVGLTVLTLLKPIDETVAIVVVPEVILTVIVPGVPSVTVRNSFVKLPGLPIATSVTS